MTIKVPNQLMPHPDKTLPSTKWAVFRRKKHA